MLAYFILLSNHGSYDVMNEFLIVRKFGYQEADMIKAIV